MCSGVVYASKTRCFGASNSRRMRICVSDGSVTTALPLLTATVPFLLGLELFDDDVHRVEPVVPHPLVALQPVVDGPQWSGIEAVEPPPALVADVDQPDLAQHLAVLGDLRLAEPHA